MKIAFLISILGFLALAADNRCTDERCPSPFAIPTPADDSKHESGEAKSKRDKAREPNSRRKSSPEKRKPYACNPLEPEENAVPLDITEGKPRRVAYVLVNDFDGFELAAANDREDARCRLALLNEKGDGIEGLVCSPSFATSKMLGLPEDHVVYAFSKSYEKSKPPLPKGWFAARCYKDTNKDLKLFARTSPDDKKCSLEVPLVDENEKEPEKKTEKPVVAGSTKEKEETTEPTKTSPPRVESAEATPKVEKASPPKVAEEKVKPTPKLGAKSTPADSGTRHFDWELCKSTAKKIPQFCTYKREIAVMYEKCAQCFDDMLSENMTLVDRDEGVSATPVD